MSMLGTDITNKISETKDIINDYVSNLYPRLPNNTQILNKYAALAGKGANILINTLELGNILNIISFSLANNFPLTATKANPIKLILNTVSILTNTDRLLKDGAEVANYATESFTNYIGNFLSEKTLEKTKDLVTCLGVSAKESIHALPLNFSQFINNANIFKIAFTSLINDISNFDYNNINLLTNAALINNINFAVIISKTTLKSSKNITLPVNLSYLTEAKNSVTNYISDQLLPKKVIVNTEKIMNYTYEILATDYVSIIINTAGILHNSNYLYTIGTTLTKTISPTNVAKLVNKFSSLAFNINGIVDNTVKVVTKLQQENELHNTDYVITINDKDVCPIEEKVTRYPFSHMHDNATLKINIELPLINQVYDITAEQQEFHEKHVEQIIIEPCNIITYDEVIFHDKPVDFIGDLPN